MRSRREDDVRDHYSQIGRELKRRRSDPAGDADVNGFDTARDDGRRYRCGLHACGQLRVLMVCIAAHNVLDSASSDRAELSV